MKDSNDDNPASKYVKRKQAEAEEEDGKEDLNLPVGWFIGIGVGILLAIGGVIVWLLYR